MSRTNPVSFALPLLYPITDTRISGLSHTEQARRLIEGGARVIQLREKHGSALEFYNDARCAVDYAHDHQTKIIINDRVDIAMATGADGVHLGQNDLSPLEARRLLGKTAVIGYSTHSVDQAATASTMPIDYMAIGPVYLTNTKENADAIVGLDGIRAARSVDREIPLVAIGGITASSADIVLKSGADSVAIIRDLLKDASAIASNYQKTYKKLLNIVQQS